MSIPFTRTALSLLIGVASLTAISAPAGAAMPDAPSVTVRANDLDLATGAGVAVFHDRVRRAAESVCGAYDIRDLPAAAQVAKCRKMAVEAAAPRMALAIEAAQTNRRQAANDAQPGVGMR